MPPPLSLFTICACSGDRQDGAGQPHRAEALPRGRDHRPGRRRRAAAGPLRPPGPAAQGKSSALDT